jgi:enamine deaminase RidA (YjgF/YER057c/UK114 family)
LSGQLGLKPDGSIPQGVEAQTTQCFENIAAILDQAGASLTDIVKLQAYVTDRTYLQGYMKARDAFLAQHNLSTPTYCSTLMIVSGFANEQYVVEVEAMAVISASARSGADGGESHKRRTAHRRNHWAGNRRFAPWNHPKQRRSFTSTTTFLDSASRKPDPAALAAFTNDVRAKQIHAVATTDEGDDARIEIARKSRDYFFYSPM